MADPASNTLVAALASAGALLIREIVDQFKTQYRKSQNGDRRKAPHERSTDADANLRAFIRSEAETTRALLQAHADEDTLRFTAMMSEITIARDRYHKDANILAATVTKVELILANRIKH